MKAQLAVSPPPTPPPLFIRRHQKSLRGRKMDDDDDTMLQRFSGYSSAVSFFFFFGKLYKPHRQRARLRKQRGRDRRGLRLGSGANKALCVQCPGGATL